MAHKSRYFPEDKTKYIGESQNIVCRSSWERAVCKFFDSNPLVVRWSSEEIVIPYICATDGRRHRYFTDFYCEMTSGKKLIIEVKPKAQTVPPTLPKSNRRTRSYKNALMTYAKNASKWKAAQEFCRKNNMEFAIWTEDTLKKLGLKIA